MSHGRLTDHNLIEERAVHCLIGGFFGESAPFSVCQALNNHVSVTYFLLLVRRMKLL